MTLFEHYQFHSIKSVKPYTRLLILVVLFITIIYTLARYENTSGANATIQVAKWNIKVNDQLITPETNSFVSSVKIISDGNEGTSVGAGESGYFDITIDPSETEVSMEYTVKIDAASLPAGTTITKCEKYDYQNIKDKEMTLTDEGTKKCFNDSIFINGQALDSTDMKTYRVYFKLDDDVVISGDQINSFYANIEVSGRQILK